MRRNCAAPGTVCRKLAGAMSRPTDYASPAEHKTLRRITHSQPPLRVLRQIIDEAYRLAIRGDGLGVNYCSCPDFATNTLGTCKHIEFTLARLRRRPGAGAALARGFQTAYSEAYLRYGAKRDVMFRPGTECPDSLKELAGRFFGPDGMLRDDAYSQFHEFLEPHSVGDPSRLTGKVIVEWTQRTTLLTAVA